MTVRQGGLLMLGAMIASGGVILAHGAQAQNGYKPYYGLPSYPDAPMVASVSTYTAPTYAAPTYTMPTYAQTPAYAPAPSYAPPVQPQSGAMTQPMPQQAAPQSATQAAAQQMPQQQTASASQASQSATAGTVQTFPAQTASSNSLDRFPTFTYPANTDPRYPAYVTPTAHDSQRTAAHTAVGLNTTTGFEIGVQISDYHYQEHLVADQEFMHLEGVTFGATVKGTKAFENGIFASGDARLSYGSHDYKGGDANIATGTVTPSTHDGEDDFMFEFRGVGGYDFIFNQAFDSDISFSLAPYAGLGFRYLSNDGTGNDSNGVAGYNRYSHYLYLPVGVTPRLRVSEDSRISLNLEYDQLLYGWQTSDLSSTVAGGSDFTNGQHSGYGLRGDLMYEWPRWGVGPFFNYWNIDQSDVKCLSGICAVEPHNQTLEFGLQGKYRF